MSKITPFDADAHPERAISPVVGVVLMVVLTILLASMIVAGLTVDLPESTASDIESGDLTVHPNDETLQNDLVVAENATAGASNVIHDTTVTVDAADGQELQTFTVDYPKPEVDLETAQHDEILTIGVDTDDDGDLEETFDSDDVSGVNTNDDNSVLTVSLDTEYELTDGDRVQLRYEEADNPDSAGEYNVSVRLNDAEWTDGKLVIQD